MEDTGYPDKKIARTRNQPAAGPKSEPAIIKWEGRKIPLLLERSGYRLRSKSKTFKVDINLGTKSLVEAKKIARERLAALPPMIETPKGSLQQAADLYMAAPKRVSYKIARGNVGRLKSVVMTATGKSLSEVNVGELRHIWPAYVATRQGLPAPDYAKRRPVNRGINSAMTQAAAVFLHVLRPTYRAAGLIIPDDATKLILAAEAPLVQAPADDDTLITEWRKLRHGEPHLERISLWLTIGLARFAGLRQSEIEACKGKWIETRGAATYVRLKDWPEDDYYNKTGKTYMALILDPELASYLRGADKESQVVPRAASHKWIARKPQDWLKKGGWTGIAKSPLHRLRGLYADQVLRETENAILARQQGIHEASKNLGHTSTEITQKHYLTDPNR